MDFTLDEIYGIDLLEYCRIHSTTVEELIKKTEKDIEILKANLKHVVVDEDRVTDPLVNRICKTISKKEKHLKRLKEWRAR